MDSFTPEFVDPGSNLYFFHNVSAPDNFLATHNLSKAVTLSAIIMLCFLWATIFKALRRPGNQKSTIKRNTLKLLLGNIICTTATNVWGVRMIMFDHADPNVCMHNGRIGSR